MATQRATITITDAQNDGRVTIETKFDPPCTNDEPTFVGACALQAVAIIARLAHGQSPDSIEADLREDSGAATSPADRPPTPERSAE